MNTAKYIFKKNEVIVKKPVISMLSAEALRQLPDERRRYLCLYKQFYKLRYLIDRDVKLQSNYVTLIRRYFTHQDFNERRKKVFPELERLSMEELHERMVRTQVFVFNATVAAPEDKPEEILFYEDTKRPVRIERSIVLTMLRMDYEKPDKLKYDFRYEWIARMRRSLEDLPAQASSKQYASFGPGPLNWIGFKLYEERLMRMNESYRLCL